eukprot:TRINITY_DN5637_c0_g1_i5.p1 TRINITY_DN5637_c0_g1~~TRINITY_DN5637_c0_g1_i5.p1  ORF type:complete len:614 (-),score=155.45 TRINITY_DN5637_c0_g1_i5:62-1903(-)
MPTDGAAALDTSFDAIAGWCNNQMPSYNVSNIGSDWKDGVALLALFDGLKPDLGLVDMPSLDPNNAEENIRRGLELFEDHFGLIQFVDVETIMQCDGTELMQCMYVYLIELQRLVDELEPGVDQPVQEDLIRDMEQQLNMSYEISTRDRAESIESIDTPTFEQESIQLNLDSQASLKPRKPMKIPLLPTSSIGLNRQPGPADLAVPDTARHLISADAGKMVARAHKKFNQLDVDGSGVLEGAELEALGEWVWSSFHPGGEALSEEEKREQGAKLMRRLDANEDGFMSFDEFNGWFRKTCASIERYRRARAPNKATTRSPTNVAKSHRQGPAQAKPNPNPNPTSRPDPATADAKQMVARAQKKFLQLDVDGSGVLEGAELEALGEWVWSSFHPGGEALSEEEKNEQAAKLMRRLDANEDGFMSFDEFNGWFRKTCASIERYRRARAPNKATTRSTATTHRTRRRTTSASKEPSSTAGTQPAVRVPASIAPVVSKPKPVLEPVKGSVSESESEEYSTEYSESSSGADYEAGQDLFQPVGYLATIMKLAAKRKQLRQRAKGCGKMFVPLNKYNERQGIIDAVSYTHLRAHETPEHLVCRLLLEKKKKKNQTYIHLT